MKSFFSTKVKKFKPWDKLGIARSVYDKVKPWKHANLTKEKFEEFIELMPDQFITDIKRESEAEQLIKAIFGESSKS